MLVEFKVTNYRSFNETQTLSMDSEGKEGYFYETGFRKAPYLTHIAGFYGANGSGKSNILRALHDMQKLVRLGYKLYDPNEEMKTDPFGLSAEAVQKPTEFFVSFILADKLYEYEFHYSSKRVTFEKLVFYKKDGDKPQRQNTILERVWNIQKNDYDYNNSLTKEWKVRENLLSLSKASDADNKEAQAIYEWFRSKLTVSNDNKFGKSFTIKKSETHKREINDLIKKADIGIVDYEIIEKQIDKEKFEFSDNFPEKLKELVYKNESKDVIFTHKSSDKNHTQIMFDEQSTGTQVLFCLSGILLEILEEGEIILIDELDANMHPDLLIEIIALFQNSEINIKNAQLIFVAHNTYLMNSLYQAQIWFTQKNDIGATQIYRLLDYKLNENDDFIAHYHRGVYGAVPYITNGLIDEKIK